MSKQLFNRNDPASIKAAFEMTQEEFVTHFTETTSSSAEVLSNLYGIIRKNSKASVIQRNSGVAKNDEPIETISPIKEIKMAKKETAAADEAPKMRTETDKGEQIRVPMEQVEKMEPLEQANDKAIAKANKGIKPEKVIKEKAPKVEKTAGTPTKQDKIKELLIGGATNKEIKLLLAEEGFKVYDSEILSAKNKLPKSEE